MSEVVNNNNAQAQQNDGAVNAQVQQPVQNPPVVQTPVATTTEPKQNWFKRNWKKILAGAGAVAAIVGSGVAAYSKGKKAGVNIGYAQAQQPEEDYSLDPNV